MEKTFFAILFIFVLRHGLIYNLSGIDSMLIQGCYQRTGEKNDLNFVVVSLRAGIFSHVYPAFSVRVTFCVSLYHLLYL